MRRRVSTTAAEREACNKEESERGDCKTFDKQKPCRKSFSPAYSEPSLVNKSLHFLRRAFDATFLKSAYLLNCRGAARLGKVSRCEN